MKEEKIDLSGNLDAPLPAPEATSSGLLEKLGSVPITSTAVKDWVVSRRQHVRPWSEFLNTSRFQKPKSIVNLGSRSVKNIEYFMSNYLFVFIGLIVFCILTSPLLLIVIGLCGAAVYHVGSRNQPQKIMGREVTLTQQYAGIGLMSIPLLWLSGAGGAVFWILGASIVLIGLHAAFYKRMEENDAFDLTMDEIA